jgi:sulfonate transport system substrate-binding protein
VRRVLAVYERARTYAVDHPDELVAELVDVAGVSPEVAHIQLDERTDLSTSAIGSEHRATFTSTGEVLRRIGIIDASIDVRAILDGWLDASYLRSVGSVARLERPAR